MNFDSVTEALNAAVVPYIQHANKAHITQPHVFPGAVMLVAQAGKVLYHEAFGCRSLVPEISKMQKDTVFDVASLTKVLVTTTIAMKLVESGRLNLEQKLSHIFQTFSTSGKENIKVKNLLNHSSGFSAHQPFYKKIEKASKKDRASIVFSRGAIDYMHREIFASKLEYKTGEASVYSDLGFILLGHVLETKSAQQDLEKLANQYVFSPLRLQSTSYINLARIARQGFEVVADNIAPTLDCPWRKKVLCGEVHDDNAWIMGGVAPHAGVFSTATDLQRFAFEMICSYKGSGKLVNRDVVRQFWKRDESVPASTWALGWDTPSTYGSSAGRHFSENAVGHLGYTGCSLWIEPEDEIVAILLTNRIHPRDDNKKIKEFRPLIHDLVMEAVRGS